MSGAYEVPCKRMDSVGCDACSMDDLCDACEEIVRLRDLLGVSEDMRNAERTRTDKEREHGDGHAGDTASTRDVYPHACAWPAGTFGGDNDVAVYDAAVVAMMGKTFYFAIKTHSGRVYVNNGTSTAENTLAAASEACGRHWNLASPDDLFAVVVPQLDGRVLHCHLCGCHDQGSEQQEWAMDVYADEALVNVCVSCRDARQWKCADCGCEIEMHADWLKDTVAKEDRICAGCEALD